MGLRRWLLALCILVAGIGGGVALRAYRQAPAPPSAAPVSDLGRRIPLGPSPDGPWLIVQATGCGYPNYAGGRPHPDRQTCRPIVLLGNRGPTDLRISPGFLTLIDDRGDPHAAVRDTREPLLLAAGARLADPGFKYGLPKERTAVRLEGVPLAGGPRIVVRLGPDPAAGPFRMATAMACDDAAIADPNGQIAQTTGSGALWNLDRTPPAGGTGVVVGGGTGDLSFVPGALARADIDGDGCADLVVGSPHTGHLASDAGGGAVVRWGGSPNSTTPLVPASPSSRQGAEPGRRFGWSVAAAAGTVAVGAPYEDDPAAADAGAVYVFTFDGRTPRPARRISQDSPDVKGNSEPGDLFGWSVALGRLDEDAGVDLAVGAPYENNDGPGAQSGPEVGADAGAATVISLATGRSTQYRPTAGSLYGYAMAAGDGTLAVGAPGGAGAVDLVSAGLRPRTLHPPVGGGSFGFSVAMSGWEVAIGMPEAAAVIRVDTATGRERVLRSGQPDLYGWAVAYAGDGWLLAGAPDHGATGAAALVSPEGAQRWLAPGDGTVPLPSSSDPAPGRKLRTFERGTAVDFGAVLA
ncbi:hypothetical protein ACIBG8_35705 [Nonomuraea sp. NPDC050556]|uniref:hypothetical protein n=1 Tax=Nonomuraea sp. NPDC050556 TaxID=3364369 RepID=UPI00379191A4